MTTWFTADLHFGHSRILELCQRPFDDVDHMNEGIIENWNRVVIGSDTVIVLGDVALGKIADSLPLVGRLKGHKVLISGNHDRTSASMKMKMRDRFYPEYRKVFDLVLPDLPTTGNWDHAFYGKGSSVRFNISHYPYYGDSHEEDRHTELRPKDDGLPLLHGHVHTEWKTNGRMFNVGVDVNDYTPVHEDEIMEWYRTL